MSRRGLPFQKLRYIPNGINGDYLQNDAEAHPAPNPFSPQASPKVLSVARLSPEKGHAYLIDAWLTVNEHISTAELALVGDGPLREELEHRVHHHFLERKIHLVGSSSCVPSLLRTSDLFVLPSLAEGLPMALLEAMSFGLGVVATDVGEVSSVLNHCGRVVPPGEVTGLANALVELGANLHRARELGGAARQRVKALYSAKKMAERYGALYLEVLSQQSSPQAQA
jgi:glycosyltransferase involved in cell wall biosynthesis